MSLTLDQQLVTTGTMFRIYPQPSFLASFTEPELVYIHAKPGQIKAGPEDDRMYVVDAIDKSPYSHREGPPYKGPVHPRAYPDADGHFHHIQPGSREFLCASAYATIRRVLDIWEDYLGHRIIWHFETLSPRLEIIPQIEWNNAQSGYGFLEFGYASGSRGLDYTRPYCANFDVLAHELGHSIVFAELGFPGNPYDKAVDYFGLHESAGDIVAIIASLHFHSVVDHLLDNTKGNLFSDNEISRVGELSESREIRRVFNSARMSDVGQQAHERSLPLTGGLFDIMVEVFQKNLVQYGLISSDLAQRSTQGSERITPQSAARLQKEFAKAYHGRHNEFKDALLQARDYLGRLLAATWSSLSPDFLTYHAVLRQLLHADRTLTGGEHQQTIRECFAWREITLLPDDYRLRLRSMNSCFDAAAHFSDFGSATCNGAEHNAGMNSVQVHSPDLYPL